MSGLHPVTMQILEAGGVVVAIIFLAAFIGEGIFNAVYDAFARFFSDRDVE